MTCRTVDVDIRRYRVCPEDPPAPGDRIRSVVRGRFVDELTGREMSADLTVRTTVAGLTARTAAGGLAGLVGNPRRLFPGIGAGPVNLDMTVSAARYINRRFQQPLGPVANFPDAFQPLDLGVIPMHRQAVVLRGRVVRNSTTPRQPLTGVSVRIDGIWSTFPAADIDPLTVIEAPDLVSLRPGLYARRSAAVDALRRRTMVLAAGEEKRLNRPAVPGDSTLGISDRINLNVGHVLAIDAAHPDLAEYIEVTGVDAAATDDQPATVTLRFPLVNRHLEDSVAVRATPQPAGTANSFIRNGIAGDGSVFLNALTDLAAGSVVEIAGSGSPEYQRVFLYDVLSDADGYFRLPHISRVAQFIVHAERSDLPAPVDMVVSPIYDRFEDIRDIVF